MRFIPYPYLPNPYYQPQWLVADNHALTQGNDAVKPENSFPPVNTERLNTSAQKFQELMRQADLLISKIVNEPKFATEIMEAAQLSDKKKVQALILSTGITIKVDTNYHPFGINIELDNSESNGHCCKLRMALSW